MSGQLLVSTSQGFLEHFMLLAGRTSRALTLEKNPLHKPVDLTWNNTVNGGSHDGASSYQYSSVLVTVVVVARVQKNP